jgi:hypothetical protein
MRTGQAVAPGIGVQERKDIAERMHLLRAIRFAGLSVALVKGERHRRQCRMAAQHRHPCVFTLPDPSGIGERGHPWCSFANGRMSHGIGQRVAMSPAACCVIAFPMWRSVDSGATTDAMTPGETSTAGAGTVRTTRHGMIVRTKGCCRRVAVSRRPTDACRPDMAESARDVKGIL